MGRAKIADREIEPTLYLTIGVLGQTDRPRLGDALQTRRDFDAVAHQVAVAFFDHVAEMEAASAALRVDWPVYPRRAEHNTVAEGGNRG